MFDFTSLANVNLEYVDSACNRVVNPDGIDIADPSSSAYRYHYLGVLDSFSGNSVYQLFTGVFGLRNGYGWGLTGSEGGPYQSSLNAWSFWQQNQMVNVACAMPTPSTTMMTATGGPGGTASPGEGEGTASTTISMTEMMPSPTPVPPIRMCEQMFEEGSEDRRVCEEYIEHPEFEFTRVVKIPHTQRTLSSEISSTNTNTLFIFDADVPGSGSGASTSSPAPSPSPSPSPSPEPCEACPSNTGIEFDLPLNYIMPSGSAFVGNRMNGKRPELTIADGESSDFIIRVSRRNEQGVYSDLDGKYLFAHIEVDSKGVEHADSGDGILYLNGSSLAVLIDVALVRRDKITLHQGIMHWSQAVPAMKTPGL